MHRRVPFGLFGAALTAAACGAGDARHAEPVRRVAPAYAALAQEPAHATAEPAPEPAPSAPAAPALEELPPLPRGTTVLHIGDSMADALGTALRNELARAGVRVVTRHRTGSHIPEWGGRFSTVPDLVRAYRPDLVLVNLGGNDILLDDPSDRVDAIRRIVSYVSDRPCVWIAPPLWAGENGLLALLRQHSRPCRWFDTNRITPNLPRARPDPIHPSWPARTIWAHAVVDWLEHERLPHAPRPWELRPAPADELAVEVDPYD